MKATIEIKKSFDTTAEFSKEWKKGDFENFLKLEGDSWTVTYTITLRK